MASSDDDEDLKLALALSVQQSPAGASEKTVVDLTSDNEGEDDEDKAMKRAIALSVQDLAQAPNATSTKATNQQSSANAAVPSAELTQQAGKSTTSAMPNPSPNTSFAMDRKAMEAERLARLQERKRKRTPSPHRPSKHHSKAPLPTMMADSIKSQSQGDPVLQYPRGVIKRTFATKFPRTDDITIDELLQAPTVNIAVIASFQWDAEWLSRKLSYTEIKQYWVMNARDAATQARWRQDLADCGIPNLRIHFPPMNKAVGNAHSKYMLLVGEKKLRLVISTANMEPEYWGEVKNNWQPGVLENSVFLIDLPRRSDGLVGSVDDLTPFGKELLHFLEAQQLDPLIVKGVLKFDFSETRHLALVHSIGTPSDTEIHPTGFSSLAKAVQDLQLDKVKLIELDYTASSLGALDELFLKRIYCAAQGLPYSAMSKLTDPHDSIRIYYPAEDTVKSSIGGPGCAGVISLRKAHHDSPAFPLRCLRDYVSTRKGMLSHNKLLLARGQHVDGKPFAWVYVGSANMSESAWGAQKELKSRKLGKLTMRNWECGVVVPVPSERMQDLKLGEREAPPMSVFEGTMEVPFQHPGEVYNGRKPWLQNF